MKSTEVLPSELVQEVMTSAEMHHARFQIKSSFLFGLGEWIFVVAGAEGAMRLSAIWAGAIGILAFLVFGVDLPFIGNSSVEKAQVFQGLVVLVTLTFLLAHPSRLLFLHAEPSSVFEVGAKCVRLQEATAADLDACDRVLSTAEKICSRRLAAMWFIPATGWAVSAYLLQQGLAQRRPDLTMGLVATVITLLLAGVTAAYSRSVWRVFGLSSAVIELQRKRLASSS